MQIFSHICTLGDILRMLVLGTLFCMVNLVILVIFKIKNIFYWVSETMTLMLKEVKSIAASSEVYGLEVEKSKVFSSEVVDVEEADAIASRVEESIIDIVEIRGVDGDELVGNIASEREEERQKQSSMGLEDVRKVVLMRYVVDEVVKMGE